MNQLLDQPSATVDYGQRITAKAGIALLLGAVIGFVGSFVSLLLGAHGGLVLPAAIIDGPIILLYPYDGSGYLVAVLAGGAALYSIYGWLMVRPPRFLARWAMLIVIASIHFPAAALLVSSL